jgi:hypothetical protein
MDAKKLLAIATLVVLASACTAMRDSSRYWSDTIAQDGATQLHGSGRTAPSPTGPGLR